MHKSKNTIQNYKQTRTHTTNQIIIQKHYLQHHVYQISSNHLLSLVSRNFRNLQNYKPPKLKTKPHAKPHSTYSDATPPKSMNNWALSRLQYRQDIHKDIQEHNIQILQQNSLQLKFEITVRLNNIVQHPFPLSPLNITAQSLPPPFITTEVIYKNDRYTKNTIR